MLLTTLGPLQLREYFYHLSLNTRHFCPVPDGLIAAKALDTVLKFVWDEYHNTDSCTSDGNCRHQPAERTAFLESININRKLSMLRKLLCMRPADSPNFPEWFLREVDMVLQYAHFKIKKFTSVRKIPSIAELAGLPNPKGMPVIGKIAVWKGDITTLSEVTAIVTSANETLIGCFKPSHHCVDGSFHSAAGPRLRQDCKWIIENQRLQEVPEPSKLPEVTIFPRQLISTVSTINGKLPGENGDKTIAFPCISTGRHMYPSELAVHEAVEAVTNYLFENPGTSIGKVIFNVYTQIDLELYTKRLNVLMAVVYPSIPAQLRTELFEIRRTPVRTPDLQKAIEWIGSATHLLITAGSGFSTADGLDFDDEGLFRANFPEIWNRGLRTLRDLVDFETWKDDGEQWVYFFSYMKFLAEWPVNFDSSAHGKLLKIARHVGKITSGGDRRWFVRTSNSDELFARYGFNPERISTPQGSWMVFQCVDNCKHDAIFPSRPFLERALPSLDPVTNLLVESYQDLIPRCTFCGGNLLLCIQGGNWFNSRMFTKRNCRCRRFVEEAMEV
ncbi:hypothetical protein RUND412_006823 [Rhizina undulata]